jgi:hypothetical protein
MVELTENKLLNFKRYVFWYRYHEETDEYNNVYEGFAEPEVIGPVMIGAAATAWMNQAGQDEETPKNYGVDDHSEYQFVYYGKADINKLDKIVDGSYVFKVVAVIIYQTHRIIKLERING